VKRADGTLAPRDGEGDSRNRRLREELAALLQAVTPEWLLDASNWKRLAGFARIVPDGDVLPLRAKYRGNSWQIGVNYVHASSDDPEDRLWYAWPDLVASMLLMARSRGSWRPFRIVPIGKAKGLKTLAFRGQVPIGPRSQDFFQAVIEEASATRGSHRSQRHRARSAAAASLKTLGSADDYGHLRADGIARRATGSRAYVLRPSIDALPLQGEASGGAGEYCFPPLASLITSGGHLLLALLEATRLPIAAARYAMEEHRLHGDRSQPARRPCAVPGRPHIR